MKLLFVVPSFSLIGGVANHYYGLRSYWKETVFYAFQGKRKGLPAYFWLIPDFITFIFKIVCLRPDVVVINPSFRPYMLFRDGLYLLIAQVLRKKIVCFFHGWDMNLSSIIEKRPFLFNCIFGKANLTYVLCNDFKESLHRMNFPGPIKLITTKVSDDLLTNFSINQRKGNIKNILYLARVDKHKGIFITLDAFSILQQQYPDLQLTIVGDGCDLNSAIDYAKEHHMMNINFTGGLRGKDLSEQFASGDVYILPSYFEGMATSVLEAMAFGLPIITSPVGGVKDFFQNGKMGYLIDSYSAKDYAKSISSLIKDKELCHSMSELNYNYARTHFMASTITKKMEEDFKSL